MENALVYSLTEVSFYEDLLDMLTEFSLAAAELCRDLLADAIFFGPSDGETAAAGHTYRKCYCRHRRLHESEEMTFPA